MKRNNKLYYFGAVLTLATLCCEYSALTTVMLIVGFSMVLAGYVK